LAPVTGTAAGCACGVAVAVPLPTVVATDAEAETVVVADGAAVGVAETDGAGVSVSVGLCAWLCPLKPSKATAPKIRTASPAIKIRPILLLLSLEDYWQP